VPEDDVKLSSSDIELRLDAIVDGGPKKRVTSPNDAGVRGKCRAESVSLGWKTDEGVTEGETRLWPGEGGLDMKGLPEERVRRKAALSLLMRDLLPLISGAELGPTSRLSLPGADIGR
jgi:hypothetical protein